MKNHIPPAENADTDVYSLSQLPEKAQSRLLTVLTASGKALAVLLCLMYAESAYARHASQNPSLRDIPAQNEASMDITLSENDSLYAQRVFDEVKEYLSSV